MPKSIPTERKAATQRVTLVGAVINLLLSIAQLLGGVATQSQALIADGLHTLSDLASDFVVLAAASHAHKDADDDHPYGHGRIETVATVILGLMLAGVAIAIFMRGWDRLFLVEPLPIPHPTAMVFAALAILSKEALYHYTLRTAKRFKSSLLQANAWHHRSDAISSVIVLLGIGGAQFGLPWLDPVAAMLVALMIMYMAWNMIMDSASELVDTGIEPEEAEAITHFIRALDGVESVHMLRTRKMGGAVFADAHIQVSGQISVSEGHHIAEYVMRNMKKKFPDISDVTVHIDPEDDETSKPSASLPTRKELMTQLRSHPLTTPLWPQLEKIILHYIDGSIRLEMYFPTIPAPALLADFKKACDTTGCIGEIAFYQSHALK